MTEERDTDSERDPFSPDAARTLSSALDDIIPRSDARGMQGAGELGVARHVTDVARRDAAQRALLASALDALAARARARGAAGFADMTPDARREALAETSKEAPEAFQALVVHAYGGYYQSPRVAEAIGLPPRPPFPQGFDVEPGDLTLLDRVRALGPRYREW